jgi:hypothetical protein
MLAYYKVNVHAAGLACSYLWRERGHHYFKKTNRRRQTTYQLTIYHHLSVMFKSITAFFELNGSPNASDPLITLTSITTNVP